MRERQASLQVSHLQLKNWKNFANCDVSVASRAFLVGPNASGKSNFLDAFHFLRDLASPGGGFQEAVHRRTGVSAIRCLAARRYPDIELRVAVQAREASPRWEYELGFNQDKQRRARITRERVVRDGEHLLERPSEDDEQDPDRLTQTHLEQVNVNRSFRDLVSFFESIRYLHIVPQLVREPDRSVGGRMIHSGETSSNKLPRRRRERARARRGTAPASRGRRYRGETGQCLRGNPRSAPRWVDSRRGCHPENTPREGGATELVRGSVTVPDGIEISAAVEGLVDEAVARRLIIHAGARPGPVYGRQGKPFLRQKIAGYNNAARRACRPPFFLCPSANCCCTPTGLLPILSLPKGPFPPRRDLCPP